ncbi:MAG: PQQ-dependent sugar dehydrogenase [Proteobacteria bacterium]|nr:PQQ-dependent sugar dehydrogenase [Pseudomonadota bacterium]
MTDARLIPGLLTSLALLSACPSTPDPDEPPATDFDCSTVPDTLEPAATVEGARAYKGLAFDDAGLLVGSDTSALIKSSRTGDWSVFVPGVGEVEGMVYLPDGDLVVTTSWDDGNMRRITPDGGISLLVAGLGAYSVILGPDGRLYAAG